jgi:hypothetical protein
VTGVPIVIGLQSFSPPTDVDTTLLQRVLDEELSASRARYPNSPLELLIRAGEPLRAPAAAAAAARGAALRESAAADLADHCHILLRIGRPAAGAEPAGSAVHLEARYQVELLDVAATGTLSRHWSVGTDFDLPASEKAGDRALRRTDQFNEDSARLQAAPLPQPPPLARPGSTLADSRCARLQELFLAADSLSTAYQRRVERAFELIFALASAAVVIYGLFSVFAATRNTRFEEWLLAPYLLLLLLAYAIYYRARRSRIHDRFVEYRALAEGLRVQFYWCACGLQRTVADCYLLRHPLQLYWIRLALRSVTGTAPAGTASEAALQELLRYWITRERTYYTRTVARARSTQRRTTLLVLSLFVVGGIATLLVLLQSQLPAVVSWLRQLGLITFVCPSIAAACVALANKLGVAYRAKHHARMLELYTQAERYFGTTPPDLAGLAVALGEATLHESGEWTLFRREQRIDEPVSPFRRPR